MTKLKSWGRNNSMNVQKTMWGATQISTPQKMITLRRLKRRVQYSTFSLKRLA